MAFRVEIITFNLTGQKSISPPPTVVRKMRAYVRDAHSCGVMDHEIAGDIAAYWPNPRRVVAVETEPGGDVHVLIMPPAPAPECPATLASVRSAIEAVRH